MHFKWWAIVSFSMPHLYDILCKLWWAFHWSLFLPCWSFHFPICFCSNDLQTHNVLLAIRAIPRFNSRYLQVIFKSFPTQKTTTINHVTHTRFVDSKWFPCFYLHTHIKFLRNTDSTRRLTNNRMSDKKKSNSWRKFTHKNWQVILGSKLSSRDF